MITVYDSTGRISYTVDAPYPKGLVEIYDGLAAEDVDFNVVEVEQVDISDKYIDLEGTPTIEERPVMALNYEVTENSVTLTGLPEDAEITIDSTFSGTNGTEDTVLIEAEDPGSYLVEVSKWPFKSERREIKV